MDRGDAGAFIRRAGQYLGRDPTVHFVILIASSLDFQVVRGLNTRELVLCL